MKTSTKTKRNDEKTSSVASISRLKGRQSVRVTFSLSEGCIDAISIIAGQMGIKQKSIFDYITEDSEALVTVAGEIKQSGIETSERMKKAYVINRKSMDSLEKVSSNHRISRDALIEYSIKKLLPLISQEKEKHDKRKAFLSRMKNHFKTGEKLLAEIRKELGKDDPIIGRFSTVMADYKTAKTDIEKFIHKTTNIENFNADDYAFSYDNNDIKGEPGNG